MNITEQEYLTVIAGVSVQNEIAKRKMNELMVELKTLKEQIVDRKKCIAGMADLENLCQVQKEQIKLRDEMIASLTTEGKVT